MATESPPSHTAEVARVLREVGDEVVVPLDKNSPPPRAPEKQLPAVGVDYAAQLRAATDYLDFVRALMPAAQAGDAAAQFHIFRALDYCAIEYRVHIDRGGVRRTLDDALRTAAGRWPYDSETVRRIHARCYTLVESEGKELSERSKWLRLASEGGQPIAQAIASHRKPDSSLSGHSEELADSEEGRRLLASAIRSGDPEVLWEIGNYGLAPAWDDDLMNASLAWFLASCQRGLDCSPRSDLVRGLCVYDTNCQPYETVEDVLRRGTENDYPVLEARARWINQKLDAGDWAALGF